MLIAKLNGLVESGQILKEANIGQEMLHQIKNGTKVWSMLAMLLVTNVEFMHQLHNGLQFLDQNLLYMEIICLFGMHIMTVKLLLLILLHLEDGKLLGQNNLQVLQLSVQWELIKILYQMHEFIIKIMYQIIKYYILRVK